MAKVKYTAIVAEMRNKLNGNVFSKNRYGNYVRNKVTPVNPRTSFQQNQRAFLATLSSTWRTLTDLQRLSWINGAANFPRTDIFGDKKILSGQALFVALNKNLLNAGQPVINVAPLPGELPQITPSGLVAEFTVATSTSLVEFSISPAAVPAGHSLFVYATPTVGPGISFVKNRFRFLGTATAAAGVVDISAMYTARFGNLTIGEKVFIQVAIVNNSTGQVSIPQELSTTVVAG